MNTFDFYTVTVGSNTITSLKKAGIDRSKIERRSNGFVVYGTKVFRRWYFQATVGYFELSQVSEADACAASWKNKGVTASVNYHASS